MSEWQSSWTPKIGMKVVCVNHTRTDENFRGPRLQAMAVYTISGWRFRERYNEICLMFLEHTGALHISGVQYGYRKSRFRPVVERKTDISIFQAMLKDTRESIDA